MDSVPSGQTKASCFSLLPGHLTYRMVNGINLNVTLKEAYNICMLLKNLNDDPYAQGWGKGMVSLAYRLKLLAWIHFSILSDFPTPSPFVLTEDLNMK